MNEALVAIKEVADGFVRRIAELEAENATLKNEMAKEALSLELNYGDTTVVRIIAERLRQLSAV